jgi:hypothetical protein
MTTYLNVPFRDRNEAKAKGARCDSEARKRRRLAAQLMDARRRLRGQAPADSRAGARAEVDAAKVGLGERGPVWWTDGEPDFNRRLVKNTPYAVWYAILQEFA